jgi:ATP-dependent Clp protease ATP-binding subunit ClpA
MPQHANHPLPYPRVEAATGGGGRDDARKVLDVMLKPVRCNPVLVGDAGSDTVMMEAVPSIL